MADISKPGNTLYIKLSVFRAGNADPTKNLTISCPVADTRFKTTLSEEGLKKFKEKILSFYKKHVLDRQFTDGKA